MQTHFSYIERKFKLCLNKNLKVKKLKKKRVLDIQDLSAFEFVFYFLKQVDGPKGSKVVDVNLAQFFQKGVGRDVVKEQHLSVRLVGQGPAS